MNELVRELTQNLTLEHHGENRYRGRNQDFGGPNVFGGQMLGQALSAACRTVEGKAAHSMHAYFLRPGDKCAPVDYEVQLIREGRSYANRRVVACQGDKPIFDMSVSFQVSENGLDHHFEMPQVPDPEVLPSMAELAVQAFGEIPERMSRFLSKQQPFEFRPVKPTHPLHPEACSPFREIWMRCDGVLPEDQVLHKILLAYASDYSLLGTALLPHAITFWQGQIRAASLDHSLWFHRDFRMDEWLLYVLDSPSAANGRGLSRGNLFTREGKLVASVAQEGMIRKKRV
jgi:acyl-CoA thioesterase-2